jgi:hypothetical protein
MLAGATTEVAEIANRPGFAWSDTELSDTLTQLQTLRTRVTAAIAGLAHEARGRDLPHQHGAASAVSWLRDLLRISPSDARSLLALGTLLDQRPTLADALAAGHVNDGQALAIGRVLREVTPNESHPADTADAESNVAFDAPAVDKVETILIGFATEFEPTLLRRLGERALSYVDPDWADRQLRDRLDREQRHARARRGFTISPDGLGGMRLTGILDVEGAAIVTAAIDPLSAPARGADGPDLRTPAARRADALIDVCRIALAAGGLPDDGGQPPQLAVTVDFEALRRGTGIGHLDTGHRLSPTTVRRIACGARLLPAVFGTAAVPIDLGRSRRLFAGAARHAVLLRDGGCAFPGCTRPPRWTDIHHIVAWFDGGLTDLDNGVALCPHHHRVIHHSDWTVRLGSDRRPEFIPPPHIDPHQRPRRNPYHDRR